MSRIPLQRDELNFETFQDDPLRDIPRRISQGPAKGVLAKGVLLKGALDPVSILELHKIGFREFSGPRILIRFNSLEPEPSGYPILCSHNMDTGSSAPFNKTPLRAIA